MERAIPAFRDRSVPLTTLAVLGVASGLLIATLLSRDPREAVAYAVACLMIGGSIALGLGGREASRATATERTPTPPVEVQEQVRAAAHDLKAPLLTVTSYLELIANGAFGEVSDDVRAAVTRAAAVSASARMVVDSVLGQDATASDAPSTRLRERVDVDYVLSEVLGALNSAMRERQANVAIEGKLPVILGEDVALFRVLENVLQNAIKFCPRDTTPQIVVKSTRLDATFVELTVTDNGPGLGGDGQRLTYRGARGQTGVPGHGLGLATVARLVTRMGGSVRLESPAEGGTTVRLTLRAA